MKFPKQMLTTPYTTLKEEFEGIEYGYTKTFNDKVEELRAAALKAPNGVIDWEGKTQELVDELCATMEIMAEQNYAMQRLVDVVCADS